jgi:16S rRNA (cytidine1402-2'-O)-methyltransferase
VLLEAPGRLAATLADLASACGDRPVAVVRELTKVHEEIWRGTLVQAATEFADREVRGEVVIVGGGGERAAAPDDETVRAAVVGRLAQGVGTRRAAEAVAAELGVSRRRAYALAVDAQRPEAL